MWLGFSLFGFYNLLERTLVRLWLYIAEKRSGKPHESNNARIQSTSPAGSRTVTPKNNPPGAGNNRNQSNPKHLPTTAIAEPKVWTSKVSGENAKEPKQASDHYYAQRDDDSFISDNYSQDSGNTEFNSAEDNNNSDEAKRLTNGQIYGLERRRRKVFPREDFENDRRDKTVSNRRMMMTKNNNDNASSDLASSQISETRTPSHVHWQDDIGDNYYGGGKEAVSRRVKEWSPNEVEHSRNYLRVADATDELRDHSSVIQPTLDGNYKQYLYDDADRRNDGEQPAIKLRHDFYRHAQPPTPINWTPLIRRYRLR